MRIPGFAVLALLLLCALAAACSSSSAPEGPSETVQEFYALLNDGKFDAARRLYNTEAQAVLGDPDIVSDAAFATWAEMETKKGRIERVKFVSQETDEDRATVECELHYSDGTSRPRSMSLTLEDGGWRLGLLN